MPELPEVETIRLGLQSKIIGQKIKSIQVLNPKSFFGDSNLLINKKISGISRKAKVLMIEIDKYVLLIHLKMSGQLIFHHYGSPPSRGQRFIGGHPTKDMFGELPNKSTRVIFEFSDNSKLYFNDQRKFGWIKLVRSEELGVNSFLNSLGPEPLEKEFTFDILKERLKKKTQKIKVLLLDQSVVSGLGNIYVSEALFNAGIDPQTKTTDLNENQIKKLHRGIIKALLNGIKYGGSSKTHFVDADGKKGYFLDYAFVYGRNGKPCKVCKTLIEKIQINSRGTYFCPKCQNL